MTLQVFAVTPEEARTFRDSAEAVEGFLMEHMFRDGERALNLEKEWHAIGHLLRKAAGELSTPQSMLFDGTQVGSNMGYGPPLLMAPDRVAAFGSQLEGLTPESAAALFDFDEMAAAQVYPNVWSRRDAGNRDLVLDAYAALCSFVQGAARRGDALMTAIF